MQPIQPRQLGKVRFLEPGNRPYRRSLRNLFTYDRYIRNPSLGLTLLATVVKDLVPDTLVYSESISRIEWDDVLDADVVFIGAFTFAAPRAYELATFVTQHSDAVVVLGGLHPSLNFTEAVHHADYVILGEADESILDFLSAWRDGRPIDFPGVAYIDGDVIVHTGDRAAPTDIERSPDHTLVHRYSQMVRNNTLWPQVLASRGCPYRCDYCAVVRHWGNKIRGRSPEAVVADIKSTIAFYEQNGPRLARLLWIVDDNFFALRTWAKEVLQAIIDSDIDWAFTAQARWEVGLDDEMLDLLQRAGFTELAIGIEFLEDEAFETYNKTCTTDDIMRAIANIQRHGMNVRGLFILGADNHTRGVGARLAEFVIANGLRGMLVQSMYFIPGTPVYDTHKGRLIHRDWSKFTGNVVHYPTLMTPYELNQELVQASRTVYSYRRLIHSLLHDRGLNRVLFAGEFFWQRSVAADRAREGRLLKDLPAQTAPLPDPVELPVRRPQPLGPPRRRARSSRTAAALDVADATL